MGSARNGNRQQVRAVRDVRGIGYDFVSFTSLSFFPVCLSLCLSVSLSLFSLVFPSPSLYLCCFVKTSIHYIIIGNCEEDACYVNPYKLNQNFIPELPPNPPLPEAPSPPPDGVRRRRKLLEERLRIRRHKICHIMESTCIQI